MFWLVWIKLAVIYFQGVFMMDIAYLGLTLVFFAITAALVYGCEKLRGQP
jgi:hypothetical protein